MNHPGAAAHEWAKAQGTRVSRAVPLFVSRPAERLQRGLPLAVPVTRVRIE